MPSLAAPSSPSTDERSAASVRDLVKVYGSGPTEVLALDHVDADIPSGRLTAIMGPSGSGKSTLLHLLAGLEMPTSGTVRIGGTDLGGLSDVALTRLRRSEVGFVFQDFNLIPSLDVATNVELPLRLDGRRAEPAWLDTVIEAVGLGTRLHHLPAELSGGQQQRVAVARALLTRPAIVFADEPTGNLDSNASAEVLSFLRRSVRDLGQSVVMVTHDPHAAVYADRVVFLADGSIVGELTAPTVPAVLDRMRHLGG
jgi:putative ABC transport system ATP-binding protein